MLDLLPVLPPGVWQLVEFDEKAYRLLNTMRIIYGVFMHPRGDYILGSGESKTCNPFESRVFCGFGPSCQEPAKWHFQMLRFLSRMSTDCYKVGIDYFTNFVEKNGLVPIRGETKPEDL